MLDKILQGPPIHYSRLPPAKPGSPLAEESETYRREVERLLAEGREGKFVLIRGTELVGFYDTFEEASREGTRRYFVKREPYLIKQVLTYEPTLIPSVWMRMVG